MLSNLLTGDDPADLEPLASQPGSQQELFDNDKYWDDAGDLNLSPLPTQLQRQADMQDDLSGAQGYSREDLAHMEEQERLLRRTSRGADAEVALQAHSSLRFAPKFSNLGACSLKLLKLSCKGCLKRSAKGAPVKYTAE